MLRKLSIVPPPVFMNYSTCTEKNYSLPLCPDQFVFQHCQHLRLNFSPLKSHSEKNHTTFESTVGTVYILWDVSLQQDDTRHYIANMQHTVTVLWTGFSTLSMQEHGGWSQVSREALFTWAVTPDDTCSPAALTANDSITW